MKGYVANNARYLPVKIHIKEPPKVFERFGAQRTPMIQVLHADGTKRHQFDGYLVPDDFLAQLQLGLAHSAFGRQQWNAAETAYTKILKRTAAIGCRSRSAVLARCFPLQEQR